MIEQVLIHCRELYLYIVKAMNIMHPLKLLISCICYISIEVTM